MRVLFIGDVIGKPGRVAVAENLSRLKYEHQIDFTIINAENVAGGIGLTQKSAQKLFSYGADVLTTGNHVWKYKEIETYIDQEANLIRPLNYPAGVPGKGSVVFFVQDSIPVAVINVMGRMFMRPLDCPFRAVEAELKQLKKRTAIIIVDFHGEATSEKNAFGQYFDGQVSAILGTHTHIQTADERVLPKGTAFITDVGMVGGLNSVIGAKAENVIAGFLTGMPNRNEPDKTDITLNGVVVDVDDRSGKARSIQRIRERFEGTQG